MLTLSLAGLRLHIDLVKTVLNPWPAIHGVETTKLRSGAWVPEMGVASWIAG